MFATTKSPRGFADSKFTLNPFKKLENEALGGKHITGALGGIAAATPNALANIAAAPGGLKGKLKAAALSPFNTAGAALRGVVGGRGFRGGFANQADVFS